MPIRAEFRHHYRTKQWKEANRLARERAGNKCEACGKPHMQKVWVKSAGYWCVVPGGEVQAPSGPLRPFRFDEPWREILSRICVCHLNRRPGDDRLENLACLCEGCHLRYDAPDNRPRAAATLHAHTVERKDAARPLLELLRQAG